MPDLSAGHCVTGHAGLPSGAWVAPAGQAGVREAARQACESCPVLGPCRSWALEWPASRNDTVILGGMSATERKEARRKLHARRRKPGTDTPHVFDSAV